MEEIPTEILLKVFKHLASTDLLSVSETCKTFNEIIQGQEFVKKFTLKLHDGQTGSFNRQYTKCTIKHYKPEVHRPILQTLGDKFTVLRFNHTEMSIKDIADILQLTPNVKDLTFDYVRIDDYDEASSISDAHVRLTDVKILMSESSPQFFSILMDSTISQFDLRYYADYPYSDFRPFTELLKRQVSTTSISISGIYESSLFLIPLGPSKYPLRNFTLINCELEETEHLQEYLLSHAGTLEHLTLKEIMYDPSIVINQCNKLKSIELDKVEMEQLEVRPIVEQLSFKRVKKFANMIDKFPNVQRFTIVEVTRQICEWISSLKYLKELEVQYGSINGIHAPSVNIVKLRCVNNPIDYQFFEDHPNVTELVLDNNYYIDDALLLPIITNMKKLKVLTITGDCKLTKNAFYLMSIHCQNLEVLIMTKWNQKFKSNDWNELYKINGIKVYAETYD